MDAKLLRKWKILKDLEDEELNDIAYVVMYGDPLVGVESAVFIVKSSDKVYGMDTNNLLASKYKVKIDRLCGLQLEKVVIGPKVFGGLAKSGMARLWFPVQIDEEAVIMFQRYAQNVVCKIPSCACGNACNYAKATAGKVELCVCPWNSNYRTFTVKSPPPSGTPVSKFINSNVTEIICRECCIQCTSVKLGGYSVEYCSTCKTYPEFTNEAPPVDEYDGVVDISCGEKFFTLLFESNDLIVRGIIRDIRCGSPVCNPDQITIEAISCGSNHLAAISSRGELYTCGWGGSGQLGYPSSDVELTLRKVSLEGVVEKVCCGHSATVCLMRDGSVYCFGSHMKLSEKGSLLVNQLESDFIAQPTKILVGEKFIDIASLPFTNRFFAQTKSLVCSWGPNTAGFPFPEVVGATNLFEALINQPIATSCGGFSSQKTTQVPTPVGTDFAFLFGKKHLSDFILKLSDGDFPVHSVVLYTKSAYFRDILKDTDSIPKELDMACYNPVAYKALLKYFYQLPPNDLDCSDLVDLHILATSYKETVVVADSYNKLKEIVSIGTVKFIRTKAVAADCKDLLELCDAFMRTPKFQAELLDMISQMPEHTVSFLP